MVAPATWMFAPVIWMVPPLVPLRLPAADSVPDTVTVGLRARAYRLVPVGPPSTILPLWLPMVSASITPELLMTESTILRAATAVSTTVPPLALSVPALLDQRFERLAGGDVDHLRGDLVGQPKRDQIVAVHVERERVARRKRDGAEPGDDGAGIAYARRHQCGEAAGLRRDRPQVDDRGVWIAGDVEIVVPGHEIAVGDVAGGRHQAADIDARPHAEQDAVGIDQKHLAVRRQRAEDLRGALAAGDAIELGRTRTRHVDLRLFARADVEGLPVDDGVLGRLIDHDVGGALALYVGGAADHLGAVRPGERRRGGERQEGRGRQNARCHR